MGKSLKLCENSLQCLKNKKNLLAFSAGVDSSALFFLLNEQGINFDVACVNYKSRQNSDKEALHVKLLAKKYSKIAYIHTQKLPLSNFEFNARKIRYNFFEKIINENGYENLILAHQLNDRLEWFMMQLCKGAGISELSGFEMLEIKPHYTLVRPLICISKNELLEYLLEKKHPYFLDESNEDEKFKRNFFRKNFVNELMQKYENGIKKSFDFISLDKKILNGEFFYQTKELFVYKLTNELINIRLIDKAIKQLGYVLSEASRLEAIKNNAVISHKIAVGKNEKYGFIAPFRKIIMEKKFKEKCRIYKIPLHVRGYLFEKNIKFWEFL